MFNGCTKLTSFSSDLSKLTHATDMFSGCFLNKESVVNVLKGILKHKLNSLEPITIGVGFANDDGIK
jgi:hypothetical protein